MSKLPLALAFLQLAISSLGIALVSRPDCGALTVIFTAGLVLSSLKIGGIR